MTFLLQAHLIWGRAFLKGSGIGGSRRPRQRLLNLLNLSGERESLFSEKYSSPRVALRLGRDGRLPGGTHGTPDTATGGLRAS
eukprot:753509-Prorocentrum_minimum.AAC.2